MNQPPFKAPDFSLPDENGDIKKLTDFRGSWLILYFYPKDDTPGCTVEACSFRDGRDVLQQKGAKVIGVSKDGVASHKKFTDKYKLNFTLLSDPALEVVKSYGAYGKKKMFGKVFPGVKRNTYLINPAGEIVKKYFGVNPTTHVKDIIKDMDELNPASTKP